MPSGFDLTQAFNPSSPEMKTGQSEVQGHLQQHSELKASLGDMTLTCLKTKVGVGAVILASDQVGKVKPRGCQTL